MDITGSSGAIGSRGKYLKSKKKQKELKGNFQDIKKISKGINWKNKTYNILLSFEKNPKKFSKEMKQNIIDDFEKHFLNRAGIEKDEYMINVVEHKNTDNYHLHITIPNLNLKTGKSLDVYYYKRDWKLKKNFVRYIDKKYKTKSAELNQKLYSKPDIAEKYALGNTTKELKKKIKNEIAKKIVNKDLKNSAEIRSYFKNAGWSIHRQGKDYISLRNGGKWENRSLKLQGKIFSKNFSIKKMKMEFRDIKQKNTKQEIVKNLRQAQKYKREYIQKKRGKNIQKEKNKYIEKFKKLFNDLLKKKKDKSKQI
jgi:hypothetical protein